MKNYAVYYHNKPVAWNNEMEHPFPAFDIRPEFAYNALTEKYEIDNPNGWSEFANPRLKFVNGDEKIELIMNDENIQKYPARIVCIMNYKTGLTRYYAIKDINQMLDGGAILTGLLDMWLTYGYDFVYKRVSRENKLIVDRSHILNSELYKNDIPTRLRYWQTLERLEFSIKDEVNHVNYADTNYFMSSNAFDDKPTFKLVLADRYGLAGGRNEGGDAVRYLYSDRVFAWEVVGLSLDILSFDIHTLKKDGNYQIDKTGIRTGTYIGSQGGRPNTNLYMSSKWEETNPILALYGATSDNSTNWTASYNFNIDIIKKAFKPTTNEWAIVDYKGYLSDTRLTSSQGKFRRANNLACYMYQGITLLAVPITDENRNHFLSGRMSAICFGIFKTTMFGSLFDWPVFNQLIGTNNTNYNRFRAVAFIQDWSNQTFPKGEIYYAGVVIYANWARYWSRFSSSTTDEIAYKDIIDSGQLDNNQVHCKYYIRKPLQGWGVKRNQIGDFFTSFSGTNRNPRLLPADRAGLISGNTYNPTNLEINTANSLAGARVFTENSGTIQQQAPFYLWNFIGLNRLGMILNNEVIYYDWQTNDRASATVVSNFTGQDLLNIISPYNPLVPIRNWMTMNQSIIFQNQEVQITNKYYENMQSQRNAWQTGLEQLDIEKSQALNKATSGGVLGWATQVAKALTGDVSQIVDSVNTVKQAELNQKMAYANLTDLWNSKVSFQKANNFYNSDLAVTYFQLCLNLPAMARLHNWINANGFNVLWNNNATLLNPNNFSPNFYLNETAPNNVGAYKYGYIRYSSDSVDWVSNSWRVSYPAIGTKYFDWCVQLLKNGFKLFAPRS